MKPKKYWFILLLIPVLSLPVFCTGCNEDSKQFMLLLFEFFGNNKMTVEEAEEQLNNLEWEKASFQQKYEEAQLNADKRISDMLALQTKYDTLLTENELLQEQYTAATTELDTLNEKYPPRLFTDEKELVDWANANPITPMTEGMYPEFTTALSLQATALADGHVINIENMMMPDTGEYAVCVTAYIGGKKYYWQPDVKPHIWWLLMQ